MFIHIYIFAHDINVMHTLQHTATHSNKLQHTAKHFPTLQHTTNLVASSRRDKRDPRVLSVVYHACDRKVNLQRRFAQMRLVKDLMYALDQ